MHTLRTLGIAGGAVAFLLAGTVAFAEERPTSAVQSVKVEAVRAEKVKVESANAGPRVKAAATAQKEIKEVAREEAKTRIEVAREEAKNKMEVAREEAKVRVEAKREEAKVRIEAVREEAKTRVEAKREKAVQRVAEIQDKAKQKLAERLANQFEHLNKTWTDHFMNLLDRYDEIVLKMRARTSAAAGAGRDVAIADAAIQSAETAIQTARAAVVAQAAKAYTLDTSAVVAPTTTTTPEGQSELMQGLRTAFQDLHSVLFKDLFALRDGAMKDARAAVQSALQALSQVPKVDEKEAAAASDSNQ